MAVIAQLHAPDLATDSQAERAFGADGEIDRGPEGDELKLVLVTIRPGDAPSISPPTGTDT
jgi:hypothetical protein